MSQPTKAFKRQLWKELSSELPQTSMTYRFKVAATATLAFVLLLGGTSVYAYESPEVSEGHALHPIKEGIERMEEKFKDGKPEGRAGFHLKMMGRRLDEADRQEMEDQKAELLERATTELGLTEEELKDAMFDPEARAEILEQLGLENERMFGMMGPPPHMVPKEMMERMQEVGPDIMENEGLSWDEQREQMRERMRAHWQGMHESQE